MKTVVVVTGGRSFEHQALGFQVLDDVQGEVILVVHGACKRAGQLDLSGADRIADDWATLREVPCLRSPAQWSRFGKAAGPVRNRRMLKQAQTLARLASAHLVVIAFPGGKGTADCVRRAQELGLQVVEVGT